MYYHNNEYFYPYYHPNFHSRNDLESQQLLVDAVAIGIKREATAIDLYQKLYRKAPNQKHQRAILYAIEGGKANLNNFINLHFLVTGMQPRYEIDKLSFTTYREGIQLAHKLGVEGIEEYERNYSLFYDPQVQYVFLYASSGDRETTSRFEQLYTESVTDFGSESFVVDISNATKQNTTFRTALWTGKHLQLTLMSIGVAEDIGLEAHPNLDQFIRIEEGEGLVQMGDTRDKLDFEEQVRAGYAIFIPAGRWHNLTNTGDQPIKLYSIYAPPEHPYGTVHETKEVATAAEAEHDH
ncbi:MAG: cupin domain-containing protein [Bacillaceae bacterium]|nr:cupin domain-containing protein [Bacillaceae bacterium]